MTATKLFAVIGLWVAGGWLIYTNTDDYRFDSMAHAIQPYPRSSAQKEICQESPAARDACCVRHDKDACLVAIKEYFREMKEAATPR